MAGQRVRYVGPPLRAREDDLAIGRLVALALGDTPHGLRRCFPPIAGEATQGERAWAWLLGYYS